MTLAQFNYHLVINMETPSLEIKPRKGHEEKIIKGIYHRTRSIFGQDIDEQYIACGISHALQYPELLPMDAIHIGVEAIKLMMGCSLSTQLTVQSTKE